VERTISLTCAAAITLWVMTFGFVISGTVMGLVIGEANHLVIALMAQGLALSAAAATMTIRLMLRRQYRLLRDAFQLGQDSAGGASMRRVR
jgi:hypothetical protein